MTHRVLEEIDMAGGEIFPYRDRVVGAAAERCSGRRPGPLRVREAPRALAPGDFGGLVLWFLADREKAPARAGA